MQSHPATSSSRPTAPVQREIIALAVLGLALIVAVGFLPTDVLHSIAHDTRHLVGFPCH